MPGKSPVPLFIRADASAKIGTGHVMRMLALAQAWRRERNAPAVFLCAQIPDALEQRIRDENFEVIALGNIANQNEDAAATIAAVESQTQVSGFKFQVSDCWLAADGYHFGPDFQRAIKTHGCRLLVMDDNGENREYICDLGLNQNIGADGKIYAHRDGSTRSLLGTQFALLRSEFIAERSIAREIPPTAKKILVTLGGADPGNTTSIVINALHMIGPEVDARIVVGGGNPHLENLKSQIANLESTQTGPNFHLVVNATNMPELIARADLAITAGGSTCWEMGLLGLPMIAVCIAENQRGIVRGLAAAGAAIDAGDSSKLDPSKLAQAITDVIGNESRRSKLSVAARRLVDGNGAFRVVEAMSAIACETVSP